MGGCTMQTRTQDRSIRMFCLACALGLGGLAWLAWRYLDGAPEMPWVLGGIALLGGLFAVCAPARWLRALLRWNLFSQDLFRR